MRHWQKMFLAAFALGVMTAASAVPAQAMGRFMHEWSHHGSGGKPGGAPGGGGHSVGAPGPIAGAGLPFLLLAGGYALVRRYRRSKVSNA